MKLYIPERLKNFPRIDGLESIIYSPQEEGIEDAYVLIGSPKKLIENPELFTNLRYLHLLSAGYDTIPLDILTNMGVKVSNGRGLYSVQIAEYTLAQILSYLKKIEEYKVSQEAKEWNLDISPLSLYNKKALLLGTGSISYEIAKRLSAFDVHVSGVNSNGRSVEGFDTCYALDSVDSILGDYDFIISALPSNEKTRHKINEDFFNNMKKGSILINVGRGDLIDEESISSWIDHLGLLVMDVFEKEPLDKNSELWNHPNIRVTPHISYKTETNNEKTVGLVSKNIEAFVNGQTVDNLINQG